MERDTGSKGLPRKSRSRSAWRQRLRQSGLVLDGGMSTELEFRGVPMHPTLWSAAAPETHAAELYATQKAFVDAGAEVVCTATYQASVAGLVEHLGLSADEARQSLKGAPALAREATESRALVAASIGPYGAVLADGSEYRGDYAPGRDVLAQFHAERLDLLLEGEPDLLALETIPSRGEVEVLLDLVAERPGVAAWLALSVRSPDRLADGTLIDGPLLESVEQAGMVAVGVNCLAPVDVEPALRHLAELTELPLVAYPNSGEVWRDGRWQGESQAEVAERLGAWWRSGARLIGGCCRTRPETIARIRAVIDELRCSDVTA